MSVTLQQTCQTCGYEIGMNNCDFISCKTCCAQDKYNTKCWLKKEQGRVGCKLKHRTKQKYENAKYEEFSPMLNVKAKEDVKKYKKDIIEFNRKEEEYHQHLEHKINESRSEEEQDIIRMNPTCFVEGCIFNFL